LSLKHLLKSQLQKLLKSQKRRKRKSSEFFFNFLFISTMRLFIAVEIPEQVKQVLLAAQEQLKLEGRMTKTKEFHLTLKFLGEVPEEKLEPLKQSLETIKFSPFNLELDAIGAFPKKHNPRVVWAGLTPHEEINNLQKQIDKATQSLGFEQDSKFHPHLTLARIKFCNNKKEFAGLLDSIKLQPAEFKIDSFKLIKSTLTPQGPIYETLHSLPSK
jgi:2'-5' RNA ligase